MNQGPHYITCEAEIIPGLEGFAVAELRERFRQRVIIEQGYKEGAVPFSFDGDLAALLELETVLAIYGLRHFPIPRPLALLGNTEFATLSSMIEVVRELHPAGTFQSFRLSAAGEASPVMQRLREQICATTGLAFVPTEGDLLIRLRRPLDGSPGWEVLIRLSPRPLSVRRWRVCNLPGALNASIAQVMVRLTQPNPDDVVFNIGSGSATLLIERLQAGPARTVLGCEPDQQALQCGAENVRASGYHTISLTDWDVANLPMPPACVDVLLADLPFGQLVGSTSENDRLYRDVLREGARVTIGGALFAAITADLRRWEHLVADAAADWTLDNVLPLKLPFGGGHIRPRIYLLRRKG